MKNQKGFMVLLAVVVPTIVLALIGIWYQNTHPPNNFVVVLTEEDVPAAITTAPLPEYGTDSPMAFPTGRIEGTWYDMLWSLDTKPGDVVRLYERMVPIQRVGYDEGVLPGRVLYAEVKHHNVETEEFIRLTEGAVVLTGK